MLQTRLILLILCACGGGLRLLPAAMSSVDLAAAKQVAEEARKQAEAKLSFLTDKKALEQLAADFEEYAKAAGSAREWLNDQTGYPSPAKARTGWVPGRDVQTGHEEMEKRVSLAIVKHNQLIKHLCERMGVPGETEGEAEPTLTPLTENIGPVNRYGISSPGSAIGDLTDQLKICGKAGMMPKGPPALMNALGFLSQEKYSESLAAAESLTGVEQSFWKLACNYYVLVWNRAHPCEYTDNEASGVVLLNHYRIALGIQPLALHVKLHAMSQDFAQEQERLHFFSHEHPSDPTRRTFQDRAKRVGYSGAQGENCAGGGDARSSVWIWRTDAAHHRGMIGAGANEIGLGCSNTSSVLNPGRSGDSAVTALFVVPVKNATKPKRKK